MIELDQVSFAFSPDGPKVLANISFSIAKGERIAVIGASGSGKSTLARLIVGLISPIEGTIRRRLKTTQHFSGVAIVFQNPETQFVAEIVEDDIAFGPENLGLPSDEIRRRVDEAIATVGIESLRYRRIESLSGGEKQRVALAGALAMEPQCLILDEAAAMLHPLARRELEEAVGRVRERHQIAVLQITHDMDEVARADRVLLLRHGRLVEDASPRQVLADVALLEACGLAPPDAIILDRALRDRGLPLRDVALTIDELAQHISEVAHR